MGLFDRLKRTQELKAEEKTAEAKAKKKETTKKSSVTSKSKTGTPKAKKVVDSDVIRVDSGQSARVLVTPWVSEKAATHASRGTYVFRVPMETNKVEVQKAVEALWKVNVSSVRMMRGLGKAYRTQTRRGSRTQWKKALVTVKQGQSIDVYEGV